MSDDRNALKKDAHTEDLALSLNRTTSCRMISGRIAGSRGQLERQFKTVSGHWRALLIEENI